MNEEQTKKHNMKKIKLQVGIVLLILALVLFVLTTFEFLYGVKAFLLGVFGVMFYPVLFFIALVAIALIMNKKFVYSPKYILYLCLSFFFFVCALHIAFNWEAGEVLSYSDFLNMCYQKMYTPGGLFIGVFTYAITGLLNSMAGIVFYLIGLVISIYLIVSYLDGIKQQNQKQEVKPNYQTFDFTTKEETPIKITNEPIEKEPEEEKIDTTEKDSSEEDESTDDKEEEIFIKDEEPSQVEIAKEKLGLVPTTKENEEEEEEEKPVKNLFDEKEDEFWQNRAFQPEKPQKFVYKDPEKQKIEKDSPLFEKNKEYLAIIHDLNNVNENPIINAEDYEDYKSKMQEYKQKHSQVLRREDVLNSALSQGKNDNQESTKIEEPNIHFGIEPEHYQTNSYQDDDDEDIDNASYEEEEDNSYSDTDYNEDDYIKSDYEDDSYEEDTYNSYDDNDLYNEEDDIEPSIDNNEEDDDLNYIDLNNKSQKFVQEVKNQSERKDSDSIEDSLNKKISINTARNFNFDILGMGPGGMTEHKAVEPNFSYDDNYIRPPIDLLNTYENEEDLSVDIEKNIQTLEDVLEEFKIPAKVEEVHRGAAVTRYELHMPVGIPVKKIQAHTSDIALALAAKSDIRIEAPIRGKSAVGVEVPNNKVDMVGLKEIISSEEFMNAKSPLTFALGKDVDGAVYCCNLAKTPHLLIAGSTGSGKSVCLNTLILSLLYKTSPEDLRLILVDPKYVEFAMFSNLPHMLMPSPINDPKKALRAFDWLIDEMERRYSLFKNCFVRNLTEYNAQPDVISKKIPKLPYIVLIVDEFGDLVVTAGKKDLEDRIIRLTQKARAAGIHLILATQRPSVDVITGSIKINLPTRIAFAVTNVMDSRTILDQGGAEKLLGKGDMLYAPRDGEPTRVQGAFVDREEVLDVLEFVKENNKSYYDENIAKEINSEGGNSEGGGFNAGAIPSVDSLMKDALRHVVENGQASISMLQRRFAIGYQRAAKIIDQMQAAGFISPSDGSKPRTVYMSIDDYNKIYGDN